MRGPHTVPEVYDVEHLLARAGLLLFEPLHLDSLELVLKNLKFFLAVKQVHYLAPVDLEKAHEEGALATDIGVGKVIELLDCEFRDLGHSEGLAGAGLAIGKAGNDAIFEEVREEGLELEVVQNV